MAFVLLGAQGTFDPSKRDGIVANQAIAGFASQDPTSQAMLLQGGLATISYDFRAQATTSTNDAGTVLDLSARGVTFPAGFIRLIRTDAYARTAGSTVDAVFLSTNDIIIGATNMTRVTATGVTNRIAVLTAAVTTAITAGAAVNTTPTPDTVEIQLLGMTAVALVWDVRVYIGPLVALA